ncbi:hypothetical protein ZIOFF_041101 [Zingiber officinale]|uniref:Uncharacterized protein n=2 Tax=Zingiber officinale TaxID=94328 RepID=A0A8J5GGR9_ZINOF|nr:hypothetical protein ZIOFF_041101 [Zingiber officinale]
MHHLLCYLAAAFVGGLTVASPPTPFLYVVGYCCLGFCHLQRPLSLALTASSKHPQTAVSGHWPPPSSLVGLRNCPVAFSCRRGEMVGGGSRRDDGPLKINSTNVFAALETLKKKKKSDKESKSKGASKSQGKEQEKQVFWAPAPLTSKSWADVGDDDDDDYYATTAPPQAVWGVSEQQHNKKVEATIEEESESEDDGLDMGDDDDVEEPENEPEAVGKEPTIEKPAPVSVPPKDAERQLSKKELKKKEMAELDALLHEMGIANKDSNAAQNETADKTQLEQSSEGEKKESAGAPSENRISKKKKSKKEKSSKEQEEQDQNQEKGDIEAEEADASAVDVKERIKKVASMRKKKSSKEMDAAAKAAAIEAAARSAKLAAAKKKEKNHYNQQPVR